MDFGIVNSTLEVVARLVNLVKRNVTSYYQTQSLSEVTKMTRVEPLTIVSKSCLNLEITQDVNNTLLNMFAGYYLQAVAMLSKVNNVEVVKILDRLNPDRDASGFLIEDSLSKESIKTLVLENYKHSLPMSSVKSVALEQDDTKSILQDVTNLAVGKLLNVEIGFEDEDGKARSVKIPVSVRLMASVVPDSTIRGLLAHQTQDLSLVERFHAWRSGRIEGIKDLIFCQDLIDEYKKTVIEDSTGTAQEILRRVANAKKYGLITKNPSLVSASNLFVITEDVAREVESKLGGKLSNARIREKAFDNTYAMIITVIDRETERVIFYTRGVSSGMDLSFKEIKASGKGKGPDITDILRATMTGLPSF